MDLSTVKYQPCYYGYCYVGYVLVGDIGQCSVFSR